MGHNGDEQQDLFYVRDIWQLLNEDAPTALVPPRRISKLDRESECALPSAKVKLVFVAHLSKPRNRQAYF